MWWTQYEVSISLFVRTSFILSYYSGLVGRGFTDDMAIVWTMALTESVFMSWAMFVVKARHGSTAWYYTLYPQFNSSSGCRFFWLSDKVLDMLKYFSAVMASASYRHRPGSSSFSETSMSRNRLDEDGSTTRICVV